jgi:hypothetical protein
MDEQVEKANNIIQDLFQSYIMTNINTHDNLLIWLEFIFNMIAYKIISVILFKVALSIVCQLIIGILLLLDKDIITGQE